MERLQFFEYLIANIGVAIAENGTLNVCETQYKLAYIATKIYLWYLNTLNSNFWQTYWLKQFWVALYSCVGERLSDVGPFECVVGEPDAAESQSWTACAAALSGVHAVSFR